MIPMSLGIRNFLSFDSEGIEIKEIGKINVFIGKNNSGKSNLLKSIKLLSLFHKDLSKFPFGNIEYQHRRNGKSPIFYFSTKVKYAIDVYPQLSLNFSPEDSIEIEYDVKNKTIIRGQVGTVLACQANTECWRRRQL